MTRDELRNSLSQPYSRDGWLEIVEDVFPHVSLLRAPQAIPVSHSQIKSFVQLGTVRLADERNLALFEVEVKDSVNIARNRVALRNCIASLIDQETNHGVLGIFNTGGGDYRFTFAARESYFTDDGEYVERQTAPKRYTYLLGQNEVCTTAAQRFDELRGKGDQAKLSDVIDAFSVERLNKDFYAMIRGFFARLSSHSPHSGDSIGVSPGQPGKDCLILPGAANTNPVIRQEFAVRLIGRILFAWFLKRKFVRQITDKDSCSDPVGTTGLQRDPAAAGSAKNIPVPRTASPLEVARPERLVSLHPDQEPGCQKGCPVAKRDALRPLIPDYLLSSDAVSENSNYYHDILEKLFFQILNKPENERSKYLPKGAHLIPYLNGGLFEPHEHDFYAEGAMGASQHVGTLKIPDSWFKEFFLGLEQYNFTIDENTVADTDVSIDPEILGCIFENLLAEINPETGESARKATGSFYTPREIVDYMVEESLLAYLENELTRSVSGVSQACLSFDSGRHDAPVPGQAPANESCGGPQTLQSGQAAVKSTEGTATACGDAAMLHGDESASQSSGVRGVVIPRRGCGGSAPAEVSPSLRDLFDESVETTGLPKEVCRAVVEALGRIKVLDPACGSGAFPVGMLQKMLCVLRKVDPENDMWLDAQFDRVKDLKLSKTEEDKWLGEIEHAFETNAADYGRKLGIIQNSIYGVDIQPIATEIAKLRFFLTLVVDENIDDTEPNRGILPLPNLDFKFVCANTLVHAPELPDADDSNELGLVYNDTFFADFATASRDYFYARNPRKKCDLRNKIEELVGGQVHAHMQQIMSLTFHKDEKFRKELETKYAKRLAPLARDGNLWQSYKNLFRDKTVDFFDPKYMFPDVDEGFDVVIGNPPYVRQEKIKEFKPLFKEQYGDNFTSTADLYVYFYLRGLDLLRPGGHLCYITSNKYFRAGYGKKLRTHLADTTRIRQLIDFGDAPVFTAIAYPSIILTEKRRSGICPDHLGEPCPQTPRQKASRLSLDSLERGTGIGDETSHSVSRPTPDSSTREPSLPGKEEKEASPRNSDTPTPPRSPRQAFQALTWTPGPPIADFANIFRQDCFDMAQADLEPDAWRLEKPDVLAKLRHMREVGTPLGEYVKGRFYYGIKTGLNEAFVIDRPTRDRLIKEDPASAEVIKPFLRGRDVKRWQVNFAEKYLIKIESSENVPHVWSGKPEKEAEAIFKKTHPGIHAHFQQYREKLIKRSDQGTYWWELRACKYWDAFEEPKIAFPDIAKCPEFTFDTDGFYLVNTLYIMPTDEKWLLGVLNSKLIWEFYQLISNSIRGGFVRFIAQYVTQIPIPPATDAQKAAISACVDKILAAKSTNPAADVTPWEQEIDAIVEGLWRMKT